jgi:methylthioribose-1-phosphate isomerase
MDVKQSQPIRSFLSSRVHALELAPVGVKVLDQTALPGDVRYVTVHTVEEMANAIETMLVRGAPAIGIAGAYGVVLSARQYFVSELSAEAMREEIRQDLKRLAHTRPTAVNLFWALRKMELELDAPLDNAADLVDRLTQRAVQIHEEDIESCRRIGDHGAAIIPKGAGILTHCNAGALATGGYGTALGVVRSAFAADPSVHVFADETRPRLQGARLTTWELVEDGIPVTLVTDNMSGVLMRAGKVDVVVVGADRITANGDTANKIGTYNLALIAQAHGIPFYVAAPWSTIDLSMQTGEEIPIEERASDEISTMNGEVICAPGTRFYNPAFDVTPARYITGIITERGIARPDYLESLAAQF